jgi:hypothetical protein
MPPKGKGMTMNQKRERLLRIFHEKKEVYSYPQIEKEGEKAGISLRKCHIFNRKGHDQRSTRKSSL